MNVKWWILIVAILGLVIGYFVGRAMAKPAVLKCADASTPGADGKCADGTMPK
jgi:hypothetical protein